MQTAARACAPFCFTSCLTSRSKFKARAPLLALTLLAASVSASAQQFPFGGESPFFPGLLVVSRNVYDNLSSNVQPGTILPPNCANTTGGCGAEGTWGGTGGRGGALIAASNILWDRMLRAPLRR